jgi:hypothetical protein
LFKNIVRNILCNINPKEIVKSRRMIWAGHVALMGEERSAQGVGGET